MIVVNKDSQKIQNKKMIKIKNKIKKLIKVKEVILIIKEISNRKLILYFRNQIKNTFRNGLFYKKNKRLMIKIKKKKKMLYSN